MSRYAPKFCDLPKGFTGRKLCAMVSESQIFQSFRRNVYAIFCSIFTKFSVREISMRYGVILHSILHQTYVNCRISLLRFEDLESGAMHEGSTRVGRERNAEFPDHQ